MNIRLTLALLLAIFLAGQTKKAVAQSSDVRVSDIRNLTRIIDYYLNFLEGDAKAIKLQIVYKSDTKSYTISFVDSKNDTIQLQEPADLAYFRDKLNGLYNKVYKADDTSAVRTLSEQSILDLFYAVYTIKSSWDEKAPESGILKLGQNVIVFNDDFPNTFSTSRERERIIRIASDTISLYRNKMNIADSQFVKSAKDSYDVADVNDIILQFRNPGFTPNIDSIRLKKDATQKRHWTEELKHLYEKYSSSRNEFQNRVKDLRLNRIFVVRQITFKIERGFIEDVHVEVENEYGGTDWYDNIVPIGFSSVYNLKNISTQKLFIRKNGREFKNTYIYLSDIISSYDFLEDLLTRDYAPADTAVNRINPNQHPFITLSRERLIRLIDSRIYTDLTGLDEKSPNGLVQIELSRRFNFLTNRQQNGFLRGDRGIINYLYLYGALTKFEQKLKRLPLQNTLNVQNGAISSPNYVSNLNLRQYENFHLGLDVNLFIFNWKDGKLFFTFDFGARYGHTPIIDTIKRFNASGQLYTPDITEINQFAAHTFTIFPKLKIEFISQRRIGFSLGYQYNITYLFSSNRFKQIVSPEKSDLSSWITDRRSRGSHQTDLDVRLMVSQNNDDFLFFRSRFYWQRGDANTFFPQFQLGYNYNIILKR